MAWLSVRSQHGHMILRVEDLDTVRCTPERAELLKDDLRWLGLTWEGGCHAPYEQSRRTVLYQRALEQLNAQGLVYPCFCTRAELHAVNAPHSTDGQILYPGTCRTLTPEEILQRLRKRPAAYRLRVPAETIGFRDGLKGYYAERLDCTCGDFLLRRSDGLFAYQLAVVVDDGAMGVTEVVRGADLLSSTPRQLLLYRLLNLSAPKFYHIPLLLSGDGRRLSKRDGDMDMGALREKYTPEQIMGKLAYLGGLRSNAEAVTAAELIPEFDWANVPRENIRVPDGLF